MWYPDKIEVPDNLAAAIRETERLVIFVGNGISRLSTPSSKAWEEIFKEEAIINVLKNKKINVKKSIEQGASLTELAEIIFKANEDVYNEYLIKPLINSCIQVEPNIVHEILGRYFKDAQYLTTNFDKVLEKLGICNLTHLRGTYDTEMILTDTQYFNKREDVHDALTTNLTKGKVGLFIGYGMGRDEFDIIHSLRSIKGKLNLVNNYALISSEADNAYISTRLASMGISKIRYGIPQNASKEQRILALSCAFEDMLNSVNKKINIKKIETYKKNQIKMNSETVICIGLAALNTVIEPMSKNEKWIGSSNKGKPELIRFNTKAMYYKEAGGPAYIVARLLSEFDINADLVAKIANDKEGEFVYKEMKSSKNTLHLDFVDTDNHNYNEDSFGTWVSTILIDGIDPKEKDEIVKRQRVFFDRKYDEVEPLNTDMERKILEYIRKFKPKFIYFDKFYRAAVRNILNPISPLDPQIWTIYETGSKGDKDYTLYIDNNIKAEPYFFEKKFISKKVNIVTSSFAFARDFLWRHQALTGARFYNEHNDEELRANVLIKKLTNRDIEKEFIDTEEEFLKEPSLPSDDERKVIQNLLDSSEDKELFTSLVARGGYRWMNSVGPKIIVITLHEFGCIWIKLNGDERKPTCEFKHRSIEDLKDEPKVENTWYTNSAGDVFRGALIAGISAYRNECNDSEELVFNDQNLNNICDLANAIAYKKIKKARFKDILSGSKAEFDVWKKKHNLNCTLKKVLVRNKDIT